MGLSSLRLFLAAASIASLAVATACGDSSDTTPGDGGDAGPTADAAPMDAGADTSGPSEGVYARVYEDVASDDRTRRYDGFDGDDLPVTGTTVYLRGAGREASTDELGIAHFPDAPAGTYLFDTGADEANSHNVAPRLTASVAAGAVKITTLGDSLPVLGGSPVFDTVLATRLEALATVDRVNVAVAGSTTLDWEVGSGNYNVARAEADDTDLFIISLGGNDFLYYVQGLFSTGGMEAVLGALDGGARAEALAILERALVIVAALRAENPTADFAFLLYPNYPASASWQNLIRSSAGDLGETAVLLITSEFHAIMSVLISRLEDEDLVLIDLYRQSLAEPIDPLLIDEVHFTTLGHRRVAEEIFLSLGGVVVGEDDVLRQPYEVALPLAP